MNITTKHIGSSGRNVAAIIELTIEGWSSTMTEDITGLDSKVDKEFILSLRNIADELEDQNNKIEELE